MLMPILAPLPLTVPVTVIWSFPLAWLALKLKTLVVAALSVSEPLIVPEPARVWEPNVSGPPKPVTSSVPLTVVTPV